MMEPFIGILVSAIPLCVHVILERFRRRNPLWASPGLVVAVGHFVFFGAGMIALYQTRYQVLFRIRTDLSFDYVIVTLAGCSAVTVAFVVGSSLRNRDFGVASSNPELPETSFIGRVSSVLTLASLISALALIVDAGGLASAISNYSLHDRSVGVESAGQVAFTLWSVLSFPAASTSIAAMMTSAPRRSKTMAAVQAGAVLAVGVVIFGSRLLLVLTIVSAVFSFARLRRSAPSWRFIGLSASALVAVSISVLAARASLQGYFSDSSVWETLSYSILQVSAASRLYAGDLGPMFADPNRLILAFSTVIPGVGGRAEDIQSSRIDVLVVQALGTQSQADSSGLPPSLPTVLWIGYGLPLALLIAFVLGCVSSEISARILRGRGLLSAVYSGLFGAFVFNDYKGGDMALDFGSELKRWIYILAIIVIVYLVSRGTKIAHSSANTVGLRHSRISSKDTDLR